MIHMLLILMPILTLIHMLILTVTITIMVTTITTQLRPKKEKKQRKMLKQDDKEYTKVAIGLYGSEKTLSDYSVWCDHTHLYSFLYGNAKAMSSSDMISSADSDLYIHTISMIGFPDACSFDETFGIHYELELGTEYATTGDQFAWTCGWYVAMDWSGMGDLYIESWTMNALAKAVTGFAIAATSTLLL